MDGYWKKDSSTGRLPDIHIPTLVEIDEFLQGFPGLEAQYLPISIIGEGTFSTVYKAIDIRFSEYDNTNWMQNSVQDDNPLMEIKRYEMYVSSPELYAQRTDIPPEKTSVWRAAMQNYLKASRMNEVRRKRAFDIPTFVAIKRINRTSAPGRIYDEIKYIEMLSGLENIISVVSVLRHEDQVLIVMPYFSHQSFRDSLRSMSMADIQCYMRSLLTGVMNIHSKSIIHRDLKPGNFLYSAKHRKGLIIDFGLAQMMSERDAENDKPANVQKAPQTTDRPAGYYKNDPRPLMRAPRAGTRGFRAPEVLLKYNHQTVSVDIWSVGVIFLVLLTRRYPFFHSPDDIDAIVEIACIFGHKSIQEVAHLCGREWTSNIPTCPAEPLDLRTLVFDLGGDTSRQIPEAAFDLLEKLLDPNFTTRISAADSLEHPFFLEEPENCWF